MIINFVESLIASFFFTNYFDLKINKYIYFIINFILISAEINIFNCFGDFSIILPLVVVFTATIIAFYASKNNLWEILFISFFDELIVGWAIIVSLFIDGYVVQEVRTVIAKILYFLIVCLVIHFCKRKEIRVNILYWRLLTIVVVIFYFAYIILLQFYLGMTLDKGLVFLTLLSLGLSVIGIAVLVYYISELEHKQQETQFSLQKLEMEQSNYQQLNNVSKEIKIMKHDLKHDYVLIENYLKEKEYLKIMKIVESRMQEVQEVTTTINSNNNIINAIINYKMMIANSKNIKVNYEINVSGKEYMKDYHLNELLSNLLDNAIDNCSKNDPKIEVFIEEDVFLYLEVINKINDSVLNKNPDLRTSKLGGNHGHGIKSVKRIVNEYRGSVKFFEKDNKFHASIIIPLNHPH
ncbi:GHKL domain-containing protein [Thomasclavelia cocleata]|uniref:Signal transduction histidine kinase n=2 Tax=Thomasclavelia cocleata TaxID=69824 RepID=A0A1I0H5E4_9FIRM|nr:GHKL domain-containing protein [Thomasclavelia cocleata]MCR1961027.1 GHKL domain-containing protein [Thomasclavelia cocleata]NDO41173.1 sensor histidine kinase [Thomasclavelia cocleata]PJN80840.1 GHKL domain-containing protein [Thomasclavelia cocleata]SET78761.1 Signal transduction histidine kinase [Thomasclavelia cocleata]